MSVIDHQVTVAAPKGNAAAMKRYFTNYWKNDTWDDNVARIEDDPDEPVEHTADNMFRKRGISKGDSVYIC